MKNLWIGCVVLSLVAPPGSFGQAPEPARDKLPDPVLLKKSSECPVDTCPKVECLGTAPCGREGQFWARGEYLLWWLKGADLPPLLTESPPGTPVRQAGVLGSPGTRVFYGDQEVNGNVRNGFRLDAGAWLDDCHTWGIEAGFLMLESKGTGFLSPCPNGGRPVGRPFFNALTNQPDAELVCFPGVVAGKAEVEANSSNLYGAEGLLRRALFCQQSRCQTYRLDAVAGYRFFRLDDGVQIGESLAPLSPFYVPGTRIALKDSFQAQNSFHGGVLGLVFEYDRGPWSVDLSARMDIGKVYRDITIAGNTRVDVPGFPPLVYQGGFMALSSNIGNYHSSEWVVIPELGFNLGYCLTSNVRLLAGYTFIYWPNVARAGQQIDTAVNTNLLPPVTTPVTGPARPTFNLHRQDMWVQGINLGIEFRY